MTLTGLGHGDAHSDGRSAQDSGHFESLGWTGLMSASRRLRRPGVRATMVAPVRFRWMGEFCQSERDGRLFIVTIDRPEVMNALHPPANRELAAAFDDFAEDPDLWVAIITGAGDRAFSAGNDLKFQAAGGEGGEQPAGGFGGLAFR